MKIVSTKFILNVTAVILAGGPSSRMKSNKALLPYRGGRFIDAIYRLLSSIFSDVILVTNNPEQYEFLPCNKVQDIYKGMGVLAGIHSGLFHSSNPVIFAVACDMPYLKEELIRYMASRADAGGVLIPDSPKGLEPLHAFYGKECLAAIETALKSGQKRIVSFFDQTNVSKIDAEEISYFDPAFASFINVNTPDDYYDMRSREQHIRNNQLPNLRFLRRLHGEPPY